MNNRAWLIAQANAELKATLIITKFEKEFQNGNQNQGNNAPAVRQDNNAQGNVPQQSVYGG